MILPAAQQLVSEHEDLLYFSNAAPVGLIYASLNGQIELLNSVSAKLLMPLSPDGRLNNLFTVLDQVAPQLRGLTAQLDRPLGVIQDGLRFEVSQRGTARHSAIVVSLSVTKTESNRLMAVLTDVTRQETRERAADEHRALYEAVVTVLSEGIVVHNAAGTMVMCNPAAERILGVPASAMLGRHSPMPGWTPTWPNGLAMASEDTPAGQALAHWQAQPTQVVSAVDAAGERGWFEMSALPVLSPQSGALLSVVTSLTNVTQRQRLQDELLAHRQHLEEMVSRRTGELQAANSMVSEQRRLGRAVADAAPCLIGYWGTDQRCRFANAAYRQWFGRNPEEMLGMHLRDVLGAQVYELNRPHIEAALAGHAQEFQRTLIKADGSTGHTLASYIPDLADGRVRGFNVVVSDVTELKRAELQLSALNHELSLRAAQAEAATRAKTAFLANMSHEIRTPMNAIIGLNYLLARDATDPVQRDRLARIDGAGKHLLQVINDILELSKIESGKLELDEREFAPEDLLASVLEMVRVQAREKGIELVVDAQQLPPRLRGDPTRVSQVLINLLANAVKFTQCGWVRLRCEVLRREEARLELRFEVRDTGEGIPRAQQAALFHSFQQADSSTTRRHGGTGLGLALTRHLASLMGGEVGLSSEPQQGTTVWFTAWLGHGFEAEGDAAGAPVRGLRALLIDGIAEARDAVRRQLEALGLRVDSFDSVAGALTPVATAAAVRRDYDVALLAGSGSAADSARMKRQLQEVLGAAMPPCILMSWDNEASFTPAEDATRQVLLLKPITPGALRKGLYTLVGAPTPALDSRVSRLSGPEARLRELYAGRRVLLVDDNGLNRELARELLGAVGLSVDCAEDGTQAIELARGRSYDIILMDVQMPVVDGLAATRAIRQQRGAYPPIIATTASAFGEDREACLLAGMNDHIAKPIAPQALYAKILAWLVVTGDA